MRNTLGSSEHKGFSAALQTGHQHYRRLIWFTISKSKGSQNGKYFHENTFDPDKFTGYAEAIFCSSSVDKT